MRETDPTERPPIVHHRSGTGKWLGNPDWPFAPQRLPFFYGWVVLAAGTVGMVMSVPGQTIGVSVFTDDLMAATGLSRVQISLTYLFGTLGSALFLPRAGRVYDRLGARPTAAAIALVFGAVLVPLSQLDRIVALLIGIFGSWARVGIGFGVMGVGFFALRFLGQGVLTMVSRNMAMKWFERRRGLANGIMGVFTSLGFSAAPLLFDWLISSFTWKGAWLLLGLFISLPFVLFTVVLYRDNPDECGLCPDGDVADADHRVRPAADRSLTLAEARRTFAFWLIVLTLFMGSLYGTAVPFHLVSIFAQAGLDRSTAVGIFLPSAIIALSVNLVGGWISDRTSLVWPLLASLLGMILSCVGLLYLHRSWGIYLVIVGNGVMGGTMVLLSSITWPRFYGLRHLGAISGYTMAWGVAASAVGPTVFGLSLDVFGSYHAAAWVCIGALVPLVVLSPWFRNPPTSD